MSLLQDDNESEVGNELNDIPLFLNNSFFNGNPDVPTPFSSSSSTPTAHSSSTYEYKHSGDKKTKQKRSSRFFTCKWCERNVSSLWFQIGCVPECSLAYFFKNFPELYNLAFIEICKISDFENEKLQPECAPRRNFQVHATPEDYWREAVHEIYPDPSDIRKQILLKFIRENAVNRDCIIELCENTVKKKH
jgi:hypothetical protein